jgi:hypothetical protein
MCGYGGQPGIHSKMGEAPTIRPLNQFSARWPTMKPDPQVRRFVELFAGMKASQEQVQLARAAAPRFPTRGRCDFCGACKCACAARL